MAIPQRNKRTQALRAFARKLRRQEFYRPGWDDEVTKTDTRSLGDQAMDKWSSSPAWARGIVLVLGAATPFIYALIQVLTR